MISEIVKFKSEEFFQIIACFLLILILSISQINLKSDLFNSNETKLSLTFHLTNSLKQPNLKTCPHQFGRDLALASSTRYDIVSS